jgi:uncharacterized protein (TIGR02145 family)
VKIFINYRRDDARDAAFIIANSLMARFGEANVFFDRQGIQAGENFIRTIESAFDYCRVFIPLIGKEWNNTLVSRFALGERDFVLEEISHAIDKGVVIIPVLLDEAAMPMKKDLPEQLHQFSEIQAFFLSTDPKRLAYDLENLNTIVNKRLHEIPRRTEPKPTPTIPEPVPSQDHVSDIDGNIYPVISIGDQLWMAANLKVTRFRNGDTIPEIIDDLEWKSAKNGAFCAYENDPANRDEYGLLYNWYAVNDLRSVCPEGWHVPSRIELDVLRKCSGDWKTSGGWLREAGFSHWIQPNEGASNKTGFTALPGGARYKDGRFQSIGNRGRFWSSTRFGNFSECWNLFLVSNEARALFFRDEMNCGFSIRCIKD